MTRQAIEIVPWVIDEEMIQAGARAGGAYLEQIGVTDLTLMSREQFLIFCARVICYALPDSGRTPANADLAPF